MDRHYRIIIFFLLSWCLPECPPTEAQAGSARATMTVSAVVLPPPAPVVRVEGIPAAEVPADVAALMSRLGIPSGKQLPAPSVAARRAEPDPQDNPRAAPASPTLTIIY